MRWRIRWVAIPAALLLACIGPGKTPADQIVFYNFNDAANPNVALDSSGNGRNGTMAGATYTAPGGGVTGAPTDRAMDLGAFNNGAFLDLNDIAAEGAFDSMVDNDQATIAFWLFGNDEQPTSNWTFWFGPDRQLGSHAPWGDGTVYFDVAGCCGADTRIAKNIPDASLYSGQWNHFAFVKDEGATAIYLNGDLFHDSGPDIKNPLTFISEATFGADAVGTNSHGGLMDDIGVWDTALDRDAIIAVMGEIAPIYVGGRNTVGTDLRLGAQSNEMFGEPASGVPGWTGRIVTFDEHGLILDNHSIAEEALNDNAGTVANGAYSVVDMGGGLGTFGPSTLPYPNGVANDSQDDFAVQVSAEVVIPVGTWTIGFGSDDGGQLSIPGVEFLATLNDDMFESDQIRFEGNRGHGWTVGTFEVTGAPLTTSILASFHERGGGDSFEIALVEGDSLEAANPATGWELLGNGTQGWSVTTTAAPLLSADLSTGLSNSRAFQLDVNGDTGTSDQIAIDNPDPSVFTTILNIDGVTFQIAPTGNVASGEGFKIVNADQIVGTPTITSTVPNQNWVFDASTGFVCLDTCPGGGLAGDYNGNGVIDASDADAQAVAMTTPTQNLGTFDENGDGIVNADDRTIWVKDHAKTWFGDSNFDGEFNSSDFVFVFTAGKYETGEAAGWAQGDWNGDMVFSSADFVAAFVDGGYEQGVRGSVAAVPEPSSLVLGLLSVLGLAGYVRRR
jgi:hypothetical protein